MKKRLSRFLLFARTLLTSAVNEWRITGRVQWRAVPKIFRALFPRQRPSHKPGSFWWRRMRGCQRCDLYDRRRRACGHLGLTFQRDGVRLPIGCGCFIPLKADGDDEENRCWLWKETHGELGADWSLSVKRLE